MLNLRLIIKTEPLTAGADATVHIQLHSMYEFLLLINLTQKPNMYIFCCVHLTRDRLSFHAEIHIIVGTVCMSFDTIFHFHTTV